MPSSIRAYIDHETIDRILDRSPQHETVPNMFKVFLIALPIAAHILIEIGLVSYSLVPIYCALLIPLGIAMGLSWPLSIVQAAVAAGVITIVMRLLENPEIVVYVPSVVIPFSLGLIFALTLLPGRTPLITRFADSVQKDSPPKMNRYTHNLTMIWAAILWGLALESVLLAYWGTIEIWSLFANILNYLIIVIFMAGEFFVRSRVLRDIETLTLREYIQWLRHMQLGRAEK